MTKGIFITGTDTEVGKTMVTGLLGHYLLDSGINVVTQKWIQTGCAGTSEDIETHLAVMGRTSLDYRDNIDDMSPYVLKYPASPHFAASLEGVNIEISNIKDSFARLSNKFDIILSEGAGGVLVPLDTKTMMVDIAGILGLPAVVVVGNRLGAINQTLMTIEVLRQRNIPILGIVFNRISRDGDNAILTDNIDIVEKASGVNVLGELPYLEDVEELYEFFKPIGERIVRTIDY